MILEHPTLKVLTGPKWLFEMFNGVTNKHRTAILKPTPDANGNIILDKSILTSKDFNVDVQIINPTNGQKTTPRNEMWEIPYCYLETPTEL